MNGTLRKSTELVSTFFNKGNERTVQIKKNVAASIFMRGLGMVIGLIQIPIMLYYLQPERYGIWVTIGSFIVLFNFFDIGLANGLRNKFAESLAKGNKVLAQKYVSLTYLLITVIIIVIYAIFLVANSYISWPVVFNAPAELADNVNTLVLIVFTSFSITFILKILRTIYIADQRPALADLVKLGCSIFTLAAIITLSLTTDASLVYIGLAFGAAPVVVYSLASLISYSKRYREFIPSIKKIDFKYAGDLTNLGLKFFIIQISALILFSSDNLIITQILGPAAVTPYAITFKYFSAVMIIFMLIATPYWSSFTDAYHKKDFDWIKKSISDLKKISIAASFLIIGMIILSETVYSLWLGDVVKIPFTLSLFMGINVIIMMIVTPFVNFINGVGVIKLQLLVGIFEAIVNIPLSIFYAKNLSLGSTGVILATCTVNLIALILWPIQYKKIIANKAKGIWAQ